MSFYQSKYLITIVGPTAVGKTAIAIKLAQYFQTEILSIDARQFYQGMAIGTAQPTLAEKESVPHHFLGFLPVTANYSAGQFGGEARACLHDLLLHHSIVIAVGGSGLYMQALCEGLMEMPSIAPSIRSMLQTTLEEKGLPYLIAWLAREDPMYHNTIIDPKNPRRIIRALEVFLETGIPYTFWRQQQINKEPLQDKGIHLIKIGLTQEKEPLYQKMDARVEAMMEGGLVEEVEKLYPYQASNALQTIGYRELFNYLNKQHSLIEAVAQIKHNTKQYAKKQMTWFKKDKAIVWFAPHDLKQIKDYLCQQMHR
ncbi:MAG: tRNA (adenosine(37)-N6)-dimethylallyltransferase MiaA [Candidatus Cardinium sp.]|nr:tRNA (adenosine(37)-N6)-dimethylallyltransferase MiaA [Candidatus Cardinium sp.]